MAYVAVSRAKFDARIYTDCAVDLGDAFNRRKDKEMALEALKKSPAGMSSEGVQELPAASDRKDANSLAKPQSGPRAEAHRLSQEEKDSFSIARLRGMAIVAESNVAVARKQAEDFEKSKHLVRVEIDGEQWSLVSVDQDQRVKERAIELNQRTVSAYRKRLYAVIHNPIKLYGIRDYKEGAAKAKVRIQHAREEIKQLQPVREKVNEFIEDRREILRSNVEHEKQAAQTLNNALVVEMDRHLNAGEIPRPAFSEQELDRLEGNVTKLRDTQMLKTVQTFLGQHYGETQEGVEKITARLDRVEESAKASLRTASERVRSFTENRDFFPVAFRATDGSEKTATLNELAPQTFGGRVATYFSISQRAEIAAVQEALDQRQLDLLQERDLRQQFAQGVSKMAEDYRERFQSMNRVVPQPQFSNHEIEIVPREHFAAPQTVTLVGRQFEEMIVLATSDDRIESTGNRVREGERGINLNVAHQQSTTDSHLEQAQQALDRVSAESVAANETGMEIGLAADTEAAGSEALSAFL